MISEMIIEKNNILSKSLLFRLIRTTCTKRDFYLLQSCTKCYISRYMADLWTVTCDLDIFEAMSQRSLQFYFSVAW